MKKKILYIIMIAFTRIAFSATIVSNGTGGGLWNSPSSWVGSIVPTSSDDVVIIGSDIITLNSIASISNLTITGTNSSTLVLTAGGSLNVSGLVLITNPTTFTTGTNNVLDVGFGSLICDSLRIINSNNNSKQCLIKIGTGTLTCNGNFILPTNFTRNKLIFYNNGLLCLKGTINNIINSQFTASSGIIEYGATTNQTILPLAYYSLSINGLGVKSLTSNTNLLGDLYIKGNSQLDVDFSGNWALNIAGSWQVTSTNSDPFIERSGSVTFTNSISNSSILTTAIGGENFYKLTLDRGSNLVTVSCFANVNVIYQYNHLSGNMDLLGNDLNVTSTASLTSVTCTLSGGKIVNSTGALSSVNFTDGVYDSLNVIFRNPGFTIGSLTNPIKLQINTGRMSISSLELYGDGYFTKTSNISDYAYGGNKFRNNTIFTATSSSGLWRFSSGFTALPDTFFGKVKFYANANGGINNNFIIGANSLNNYYADSVNITSTTIGGFYVGRNGGGSGSSHKFAGPVEINVTSLGNVNVANSFSTNSSQVTFLNTIKLNSTLSSTGDIYIGNNNSSSTVIIAPTAKLINGTILGATNVYLYNVIQNGTLQQQILNSGISNSTLRIGSSTGPCTFNGSVDFASPNIDIAYSTFNGNSNMFTMNGSATNQNCTGGNTFGASSNSTFVTTGSSSWRLANIASDNYLGNVFYNRQSTGNLSPAYNSNCFYEGNITVLSGSNDVDFATGLLGRVIISGNTSKGFTNNSVTPSISFNKISMNKSSGNFTLNNMISITSGGDLSLVSGKIITSSSAFIDLLDESCTTSINNALSTSYVDGPIRYNISTNVPQVIHFPIGKGNDSRPMVLSVLHSNMTSYGYKAELFNSSAQALGYSFPPSVNLVSLVHWWDIDRTLTSTGISSPTANLVGTQTITLNYGSNDGVTNPLNLTICKNTNTAVTTWIDIGGVGSAINTGSITSNSLPTIFNSFSRFTLANKIGGTNPLPIELFLFDIEKTQDKKVLINWETLTEDEIVSYEVEKSMDGIYFTSFDRITNLTKNNNGNKYSTIDNNPFDGVSYYRLKQFYNNGKTNYSKVKSIELTKSNIILYPNPARNTVTIEGISNGLDFLITIKTLDGKTVMKKNSKISVDNKITLNNLDSGLYFIIIENSNETFVKKLEILN